jgi:hypothetical protein
VVAISGINIDHNFETSNEAKFRISIVPSSQKIFGESFFEKIVEINGEKPEQIVVACIHPDVGVRVCVSFFVCFFLF